MKNNSFPMIVAQSIVNDDEITFRKVDKEITLKVPNKLIQQIIKYCNGTRTYQEILNILEEWNNETLDNLFNFLNEEEIIVDSRMISKELWKFAKNPAYFPSQITEEEGIELTKKAQKRHHSNSTQRSYEIGSSLFNFLLKQRKSTRSFSGSSIPFEKIVNILWSAYGEIDSKTYDNFPRKTVPSAGALYPIVIHVVLFKESKNLDPGIYKVYLGDSMSVGFDFISDKILQFARSFIVNPHIISEAHGVIVISGSLQIPGEKYGNRAMLYVPLESGHIAQNIHLSALEKDVATVQVGGFVDDLLADSIELSQDYHPLTTIVFGCESEEPLKEHPEAEIQWSIPTNDKYHPSFTIASAKVLEERNWAHGRDEDPVMAQTKAISEAKEWTACGNVPKNLKEASFANLETAVNPEKIIKFHSKQYSVENFPFEPFDKNREYEWTKGYNIESGKMTYILADLVYFPYFPETPYYAYANSSGVAAHPQKEKAIKLSTLELVERDSFMIAYLTRIDFPTIDFKTLPSDIKKRIKDLEKIGFDVWIKDYSIDLAPVVSVFAQNEDLGCTNCAACASFNKEEAIDHALMEVEAFVLARIQNGPSNKIKPEEVEMPLDHGNIYDQKDFFHKADFLVSGEEKICFEEIGKQTAQSWENLLERIKDKGWNLFIIPLFLPKKYQGNDSIYIVRSIVPGMIPMTFGYRQEPAGMKRIYKIAKKISGEELSYQRLTRFPHPFA